MQALFVLQYYKVYEETSSQVSILQYASQLILVKEAFLCVRNFLLSRGGGGDRVFDTMAASAYVKMLQHYRVSSHGILVSFVQESKPTSIQAD
jgi:hypothetical protein